MSMPLNVRSTEVRQDLVAPLHHQVYVVLRQQVVDGQFAPDKAMPSEHRLEALFGVSRITIRRALDRLAGEGLIVRRHGKGTYAQPVITPPPIRTNLRGMLENLLAMGLKTDVELIEFAYLAAPPDIAARLELAAGAIVQKAIRVRSFEGTPFSFLTTHIPEAIGRSFEAADLEEKPLLALLERSGAKVSQADQTISAKLADTRVAPLLQVELGAALLCVKRLVRDQTGRAIELLEALYRPDIYEYQMTMSRAKQGATGLWSASTK